MFIGPTEWSLLELITDKDILRHLKEKKETKELPLQAQLSTFYGVKEPYWLPCI